MYEATWTKPKKMGLRLGGKDGWGGGHGRVRYGDKCT